jgi:hypothetical protein
LDRAQRQAAGREISLHLRGKQSSWAPLVSCLLLRWRHPLAKAESGNPPSLPLWSVAFAVKNPGSER